MAELRYDDLQRAAQNAVYTMQGALTGLRNQVTAMQPRVEGIPECLRRIDEVDRQVTTLSQQMTQMYNILQNINSKLNALQSLPRATDDLRLRIQNIERFGVDMSEYIRRREEVLRDNSGFLSAE